MSRRTDADVRAIVFGGTFNPIHYGHLFLAEEIRIELGYDTVIFVPSNVPVHKPGTEIVEPAHRIAMVRRAIDGNPAFIVDECEIERGGNSYMIDTIRLFLEKYPLSGKPGLVIGDDLVEGFNRWKEASLLADLTDLVVARRTSERNLPLGYPHRYVRNTLLPISSSEIRLRIREGKAFRYLVPHGVFEYINAHGLYRAES
jgi:nicotinate-nucleotide adenylyltransferase